MIFQKISYQTTLRIQEKHTFKMKIKAKDLPIVSFRRGLIMGIWNSHVSVGNILGSAIAGIWAGNKWCAT